VSLGSGFMTLPDAIATKGSRHEQRPERHCCVDLEQHGGRTFEGVAVRVAQRILALAAATWHNHKTGQPVTGH